jgi:hypothetical protein
MKTGRMPLYADQAHRACSQVSDSALVHPVWDIKDPTDALIKCGFSGKWPQVLDYPWYHLLPTRWPSETAFALVRLQVNEVAKITPLIFWVILKSTGKPLVVFCETTEDFWWWPPDKDTYDTLQVDEHIREGCTGG